MPTLHDVAQLASVSTATVSRTLNNPELVDPETRSRVAAAIQASGYTRNETARSLAMRSSRTIGLLTDNFASNYSSPILDETIKTLREHGYYAIVEATGYRPNSQRKNDAQKRRPWCSLIDRQVESIIVICAYLVASELSQMLSEFPKSVFVGILLEDEKNKCITVDQYLGGRLAAKHLLAKGHRNIAMITGSDHRIDSHQRGNGLTDELSEHDVQLTPDQIFRGDYTVNGGAIAMRKIIQSGRKYSAVFAQNDNMALGAASVCHSESIAVPGDLSIIGFDNSFLATVMSPPLTTINQPIESMSRSAATLALNLCNGRANQAPLPHPQTHYMPTLIERDSVADIRA